MRVLISGSGVAGPTLAWWLAKSGARITVVEKASCILPHGQNVDIQGAAVKVVKRMDLLDEFRKNNTKEQGTQFIDQNEKPFALLPIKEGASASLSSEFEILRGDLAKMLYEAGKDHPNIKYLFGTTIKGVISNNDEAVEVEFSDGVTERFDLLVAADGQWSKVRKQCFPSESVRSIHTGMYAIYFTIPRLPSDNDWWNVYIGLRSRILTLRPDPHGTIRAMFTIVPRSETQKIQWAEAAKAGKIAQQKLLRSSFADIGWQGERILDAMDVAPDFYFHVIQQIKMTKWSKSRIVCLGDAAYAPSPLTGMGTSLAIIGAYILAGEVSKLKEGENPTRALEGYEKTFRGFVEGAQEIPSIFPGIVHPEKAWQRWLLHLALGATSKVVPWLGERSAEDRDDGFVLPEYPALYEECSK